MLAPHCRSRLAAAAQQLLLLRHTHANAATPITRTAQWGIMAEYESQVVAGRLRQDATQRAAVQALQLLQEGLVLHVRSRAARQQAHAEPAASDSGSDAGRDGGSPTAEQQAPPPPAVQGAYLFGPIGSGKTLIMDMFLNGLPEAVELPTGEQGSSNSKDRQLVPLRSQRLHFHELMLRVHEHMHQLQQALPKIVTRSRAGLPVYRYALPPEDPVLVIARSAAADLDLLCIDELHVTEVADALLLSRLFGELIARGTTVVFTSNRPPRDLYKGGLSRRYFMPFVQLIEQRLLLLRVAGGVDYRLLHSSSDEGRTPADETSSSSSSSGGGGGGQWLLGRDGEAQLQQQWTRLVQQLADVHGAAAVAEGPTHLPLPFGRRLWVPRAAMVQQQQQQQDHQQQQEQQQQQQQSGPLAAASFSFQQLCGNQGSTPDLGLSGAMGANDYLALVRACPAIFLSRVPQLTPKQRDEARRLVTLVDVIYEAHTLAAAGGGGSVRLCVSADVQPHELFLPLLGAAARAGVNPNLGRAAQQRLDVAQLLQEYGGSNDEPAAAAPAPPRPGTDEPAATAATAASLLPEEVLMYHRAASRLVELCGGRVAECA